MTKADLIRKLTSLVEALGAQPTPLTWRLQSVERLEELVADAEARLAEQNADNADSATTIAARNDTEWFLMGGTRN
jgi:hypothetical protein